MTALNLETVQWASLPDIDEVKPIGPADGEVLEEIRQVLLRHNMTDRFGVCLLHKHFEIAADEVTVEYTDVEERVSRVVVEPVSNSSGERFIQTMWRFHEGRPDMGTRCVAECVYLKGHRRSHQRVPV